MTFFHQNYTRAKRTRATVFSFFAAMPASTQMMVRIHLFLLVLRSNLAFRMFFTVGPIFFKSLCGRVINEVTVLPMQEA